MMDMKVYKNPSLAKKQTKQKKANKKKGKKRVENDDIID
jgi:hypothetical protein